MKKLGLVMAVCLGVALGVGCSSPGGADGASDSDLVASTLTVEQCKAPKVATSPLADASGTAIVGSAHTKLDGCVVGGHGETGDAVLARVVTILENTASIGLVKDATGKPVFERFTPAAKTGSLATTQKQDIDVTLAMAHSPTTTLHIEMKEATGVLTVTIVNSAAVKASIFGVTAVAQGDLKLNMQVKPAANGVVVTGTAQIVLQQQQDQAAGASLLVKSLFGWLGEQLAKTAPPGA